jgi:hypothetical protein
MCFKSSFFPYYLKSLRLVNHKEEGKEFRNLRRFKSLFLTQCFILSWLVNHGVKIIEISSIIIKASFKDV